MTRKFLIAAALSLAIAVGGLVWLDGGSAHASSYEASAIATPVTDTEACSTTGWYNAGYYSAGETVYVSTYGGVGVPYGYPLYGYLGYWPGYAPVVTTTAITIPPTPYLPYE